MKTTVEGVMRVWALVISVTVLAGISRIWGQTEKVVFVSGDVRLEDGTAPPDAVQINRACNGRTTIAARTDTMGRFTFSVDARGNTTATADASQAPAKRRISTRR